MSEETKPTQTTADDTQHVPVAIIGYGTAGVNAVIGLRNAGYEGQVCVFSDTDTLPYSPILTSYYAGGQKTYDQCFPWSAEELESLGAQVMAGCPVTELDPATHTIGTPQGEFTYSKCVIATGARPMLYGFPQVEDEVDGTTGYAPFVLRTLDDAERLKQALEDPGCQRVLISGASMVALKTLEACLVCGKQVTLVGMNPHVLDFNAFPEAAERFERGLAAQGAKLKLGMVMKAVKRIPNPDGARDWQLEVTFSNGDVERFDDISVSHGMRSNLEFITKGALEIDRALVVDEFMRTSDPDVYAAGDVVQALELVSGEKRVVGIWKNAAVQGAVAGHAIADELAGNEPGQAIAFAGAIPTNTICVNDLLFISAGSLEITPNRRTEVRETEDMLVQYLFQSEPDGKERLVGFNLVTEHSVEGDRAYDTGAMLTLRIEAGCRES